MSDFKTGDKVKYREDWSLRGVVEHVTVSGRVVIKLEDGKVVEWSRAMTQPFEEQNEPD